MLLDYAGLYGFYSGSVYVNVLISIALSTWLIIRRNVNDGPTSYNLLLLSGLKAVQS